MNALKHKKEQSKSYREAQRLIATHKNYDGFCVYEVDDEFIDNLVKEMVGESK